MLFSKKYLFLIFLFSLSFVHAQQTNKNFWNKTFKDTIETDITDVLQKIFNKQKSETKLRTKNLQIAILPALGYSLQTGFAAVITGNAGFSANRKDTNQKLSSIQTGFTYSQQNQIIFPFVLNLWTKNNKFNVISDNRYLHYPNYIYGIGSKTNAKTIYASEFSALRLHESILTKIAKNTSIGIGFFFDKFWNINGFDTIYPIIHNGATKSLNREIASGLGLRFLYDSRLNQINPSKGFLANLIFRNNKKILGSNSNWAYLTTDIRGYIPFPKNSKNVLALWNFNWLSFGKNLTNFLIPSNGWDDLHNTGRGYIQGRFRGKNMFAFETEYRLRLTKSGLLGATIFGNAMHFNQEYFYSKNTIKWVWWNGFENKV
jgi:hypothetical protein